MAVTGCEALVGAALFVCLARDPACLPEQHRDHLPLLRAIAERESRFNPYALRVEATRDAPGHSLFFASAAEAIAHAVAWNGRGRTTGLGWFQVTHHRNWDWHFGPVPDPRDRSAQIRRAFDPCANMAAGAAHFAANWQQAGVALQYYNSGRPNGAPVYASGVLRRVLAPGAGGDVPAFATATAAPNPTRPTPPTAPTPPRTVTPHTADTAIYTREMPHVLRVD